jgi:ABC-2 type transport system permease protein
MTPAWSRFLIIPRDAYRSVFQSKLFIAFFVACFIFPLVAAILIYLHHNTTALLALRLALKDVIVIDSSFFETFVATQGTFGFFLTLLVGPPLVSRDLANNALPLYLCRPFSRAEYVLGKMSVVMILLSLMTWVPGLLLFLFQAYLEGGGWFVNNLWIAGAIFFGSVIWIIILALISQAISAWVKWRVVASAALLGLFFIPSIFGEIINELFMTRIGSLISLPSLTAAIWAGLFGNFETYRRSGHREFEVNGQEIVIDFFEPPLWSSWMVLMIICVICLVLLARKVRAYEVVR